MRKVIVLSASVTPTYPHGEFDSIASAFLVLHGSVRAVPLPKPIELKDFKTKDPPERYSCIWVKQVSSCVYPDAVEDGQEALETLWFLLLAESNCNDRSELAKCAFTIYRGLVLKSIQGQSDTFSRIGHFKTTILDPHVRFPDRMTCAEFCDSFEDRTITLI